MFEGIAPGERCRNCTLIFYYHKQYKIDNIALTWYTANNQRYICPCTNFEPMDNLKYLEWKYAQSR